MTLVKENKKYAGRRKHGSQLSLYEKEILRNRLMSVDKNEWGISSHAMYRLKCKRIMASLEDIVSIIPSSDIIEYGITFDGENSYEERVVLRSKKIFNYTYNLSATFSLTNKRIITVWLNGIYDTHKSLKWNKYDPSLKVLEG